MLDTLQQLLAVTPYFAYAIYLLALYFRADIVRHTFEETQVEGARDFLQNPKDLAIHGPIYLWIEVDKHQARRMASAGNSPLKVIHGPIMRTVDVQWPALRQTSSGTVRDEDFVEVHAKAGMRPLATWTIVNFARPSDGGTIKVVERSGKQRPLSSLTGTRVLQGAQLRWRHLFRLVFFAAMGAGLPVALSFLLPGPESPIDVAAASMAALFIGLFLAWLLNAPQSDIAQGYRGLEGSVTVCAIGEFDQS